MSNDPLAKADYVAVALLPEQIVQKIQDVEYGHGMTQVMIDLDWPDVVEYVQWLEQDGWTTELYWDDVEFVRAELVHGAWATQCLMVPIETRPVLSHIGCTMDGHQLVLVHSAE